MIFFKIFPRSNSINNCKQARRLQRGQNTVPSATMKVNGLTGQGAKRTRHGRHPCVICGNNDQKSMLGHWDKALAAMRMTFDHFNLVWQRSRLRIK